MRQDAPVLQVEHLTVTFGRGWRQAPLRAVDDVGLRLGRGETLGIVGESGSGKSTLARAILGLVPVASGRILFEGEELTAMRPGRRRQLAAQIQVVFQDPYSSLNPTRTVGQSIAEPLEVQGQLSRTEIRHRVAAVLHQVGLPPEGMNRYPAQFSGGQRQRIAIARAVIGSPRLVICDEAVSALDLSVQAQILNVLMDLQRDYALSMIFIGHDLAVVRYVAHRTLVMYHGQVVEEGASAHVYANPQHPYTRRLLAAAPVPDPVVQKQRRQARRWALDGASVSNPRVSEEVAHA